MLLLKAKKKWFVRNVASIPGWRTNRKIVVIESDDWGSIRMPSKKAYDALLKAGVKVDSCPYNRYDSLESENDLYALCEVLQQIKDKNGNHPVITANAVMANPDFDQIKSDGFKKYSYKTVRESFAKHAETNNSFALWREGIANRLFVPQFHGREHLNINKWLQALQENDKETHLAFDLGVFGHPSSWASARKTNFLSALDYSFSSELNTIKDSIKDGIILFKEQMGFPSGSFIASRYIWDDQVEALMHEHDVRFIQGTMIQLMPFIDRNQNKYKKKIHYIGQRNRFKQVYITRNCFFEPSANPNYNWVNDCMQRIKTAFFWGKPIVLCTHRVNFIGRLCEQNRKNNLASFQMLLKTITKTFPDVEFLTTPELGREIIK